MSEYPSVLPSREPPRITSSASDRRYFATKRGEDLGKEIVRRAIDYFGNARVAEIIGKQRVAYRYYYDLSLDWAGWGSPGPTNQMSRGGAEGEQALIRINHCRSLVRKQIAMISNAKFERRPRATSDDYDPMHATEQCGYVLDHYAKSGGLELRRNERIENASTLGVGVTYYGFNPMLGKEYATDPDTKRIVYTGDVEATNILPWDLICDPYRPWKEQRHVTVRFPKVNRYELAARFPQFEGEILDSPYSTVVPFFTPTQSGSDANAPDDTELFCFHHARSPIAGLERGWYALVLATGVVIDEGPLEAGRIPIARVTESDIMGSPFGYPSFWEYLGVQELYDNLQSIVATNQSTFGAQNIAVKSGVDPRPVQLGGGLSVFVCNDPKNDIVPLQLTKSPAEIFPHMQNLEGSMTKLAGLSPVDLGEAQGDRQSGSALALLSAQSIRNASPYQTSDVEALKDESQIILRLLRAKATRPIKIGVSEAGQTSYERAVTGHQLGDVDAVDIELANPLQQTTEGRVAILQTFAQLEIPLNPEQAMEVVKSGNLEPVTDGATKQGMRIRLENKLISQGKPTRAILSDDHIRHCTEHNIVMSDAGRDDPKVQTAFLAHVVADPDSHYRLFYGSDPEQDKITGLYRPRLMALCGIQPPPPGPEQGQPPPPGPGAPEEGAPAGGGGGPTPQLPPPGPAQGSAAQLGGKAARLPTNAATGEQWTPNGGGGTPVHA